MLLLLLLIVLIDVVVYCSKRIVVADVVVDCSERIVVSDVVVVALVLYDVVVVMVDCCLDDRKYQKWC